MKIRISLFVAAIFLQALCLQTQGDNYVTTGRKEIVFPRIVRTLREKRQSTGEYRLLVTIQARNSTFHLDLTSNDNLFRDDFNEWEPSLKPCHFQGRIISGEGGTAALSTCEGNGKMRGLIITPKEMLILEPISRLNQRQMPFPEEEDTFPHAMFTAEGNYNQFCKLNHIDFGKSEGLQQEIKASNEFSSRTKRAERTEEEKYIIEIAVFVDKYQRDKWLRDLPGGNESYVKDRVLNLMSQTQVIFNHPTLKANIDIVVVKVEILQDPLVTPNKGMKVDFGMHLKSFQRWQSKHNQHNWDHAMLITGLNNCGKSVNGVPNCKVWVAGAAYIGGMCSRSYSVSMINGAVSAGVVAHELAHNLGAKHDADVKNCPTDGSYIMSSAGKAHQWSTCSSDSIRSFLKSKKSSCLRRK